MGIGSAPGTPVPSRAPTRISRVPFFVGTTPGAGRVSNGVHVTPSVAGDV